MNRLLLSLLLAAPFIPVSTTGMAQSQFDGRWTVSTIPEKGACRRKHVYAVLIENGVARNASGRTRADVTGGLEPSGRVLGSLQRRGGAKVDVTGNLAGESGSGHWTLTGRIACSGRWTAAKWR